MALPRLTEKQIKKDPEQQLRNFKKTKDFLIAIDTDGCVTDNMNGKQMLIFHPQFMEFYQLWGIESYFREVAEYYNLFSVDRGALQSRKDVQQVLQERHIKLPDIKPLNKYIAHTKENKLGLGNPSLEEYLNQNPLELITQYADILIVSKTPYADLANYWKAQGIDKYVQVIAGQEMGSKGHHIEIAKKAGKYEDDQVMMIGDGGGDLKAVKENNGLFYPTPPGQEHN
ncbi:hypothetical protein B6228_05240 [Candidatus Atribacteria bacterium 4572_76]|nr:MAG: hypothetical protein B6228_05240 [Candidatus Atribacteria bacterium 4572_76]